MSRRAKLLFLLSAGIVVRLIFLFRFPPFNDESIYLTWGQGFIANPARWWYWALDGKQPGLSALYGALQLLPLDLVTSVRLSSLLFSLISLVSLYLAGSALGTGTAALLFAAFSPYLVMFGTLGMGEAAVIAGSSLLLSIFVRLGTAKGRRLAVMMGLVAGFTWWLKSTILLLLPVVGIGLLLRGSRRRMASIIENVIIMVFVVMMFMLPLQLNLDLAARRIDEIDRFVSAREIVAMPVDRWLAHSVATIEWSLGYFPFPLVLLAIVGLIGMRDKALRYALLVWVAVPAIATIIGLRSITARYLVVVAPAVIVLAAAGFARIRIMFVKAAVALLVIASGIIVAVAPMAYDRFMALIPSASADYSQYVHGWTSGWGVKEAIGSVATISRQKKVAVFVRFDSGNPESAVMAYMNTYAVPNANLYDIPILLRNRQLLDRDWYFISRGNQKAGLESYLTELSRFPKPGDSEFVGVYIIDKDKLAHDLVW